MKKSVVTIDVFTAIQSDLAAFAGERSGNVCEDVSSFASAAHARAAEKFAEYDLREVRRAVADGLTELRSFYAHRS